MIKKSNKVRKAAWTLALGVLAYLAFMNTVPFPITFHYTASDTKKMSKPGPATRVSAVPDGVFTQNGNPVYFVSAMPFQFDHATVQLKFRNPNPDQTISLGFKDRPEWHYQTNVISAPFLDAFTWPKVGSGPYLYQKTAEYKSVDEFLKNPPQNKIVGTYDLDAAELAAETPPPESYRAAGQDTHIAIPLRGKTTFYVYLENEPFKLKITKRDLNWYADPDTMKITIYKGKTIVMTATIDDDGNAKDDKRPGGSQTIELKNPGPGLPESGVYKIVVDASRDSVLTELTTNLHKIAFEGPLYPVSNREVYGRVGGNPAPTVLYANADHVSVSASHASSLQTIYAGAQTVPLTAVNQPVSIGNQEDSQITIPKSDAVINGAGYFAFSKDQLFAPTRYKLVQVQSAADLQNVDYLLTSYAPPNKLDDGWFQAEKTFDLKDAVTENDKLSWVISAPGLEENKRMINLKDIELDMSRQGWVR
jgi:hypothetical protein